MSASRFFGGFIGQRVNPRFVQGVQLWSQGILTSEGLTMSRKERVEAAEWIDRVRFDISDRYT